MCKNKRDLVYRGNVVFELYYTFLVEKIPPQYFIPIKHAVERAKKIDPKESLEIEKLFLEIENGKSVIEENKS